MVEVSIQTVLLLDGKQESKRSNADWLCLIQSNQSAALVFTLIVPENKIKNLPACNERPLVLILMDLIKTRPLALMAMLAIELHLRRRI